MRKSKRFDFGKIDFYGTGRKINRVEVTIELRHHENGQIVFSASGNVWNSRETDIVCGGQCLDTIQAYIGNDETFKTIYRMWKLYHLNNMHAGTPKQEKLLSKAGISGNGYTYDAACKYLESVGLLDDNGIRYGYHWNYEAVSDDDLKIIENLLDNNNSYLYN